MRCGGCRAPLTNRGSRVEALLIVNAGSLTEEITRWNMSRDLLPYLIHED